MPRGRRNLTPMLPGGRPDLAPEPPRDAPPLPTQDPVQVVETPVDPATITRPVLTPDGWVVPAEPEKRGFHV